MTESRAFKFIQKRLYQRYFEVWPNKEKNTCFNKVTMLLMHLNLKVISTFGVSKNNNKTASHITNTGYFVL